MLELLRSPGTGELHKLAGAWGSKVNVVTSGLRYITRSLEWVLQPALEESVTRCEVMKRACPK